MYSRRFSDTDEALKLPPHYDGVALKRERPKEPPPCEESNELPAREPDIQECERGERREPLLPRLLPEGLGGEDLLLLGVALLLLFGQDNDPYIPLTLLLLFVLK